MYFVEFELFKIKILCRYRFSNVQTDFFVPNKTLYKDYIEFIKALPFKSDYEVLDLEYSCQILSDKIKGTELLLKLYYAILNDEPFAKTEVVSTLEKLLECVSEALSSHDAIPSLGKVVLLYKRL